MANIRLAGRGGNILALTNQLKKELWRRFGAEDYPAEWDGNHYGGGKMSQRMWEYFKAIELLELNEDSIVIDIGGGSPETGMGFFTKLMCDFVKKVIVIDPNIKAAEQESSKFKFVREFAGYQVMKKVLLEEPGITHIASVSVFEHIKVSQRLEIIQAINEYFKGPVFVATYEHHSKKRFFEYQLTNKTASQLFGEFTNFYLSEFHASPVWCENAFVSNGAKGKNRFFGVLDNILGKEIPGWYPIAVKFERMSNA